MNKIAKYSAVALVVGALGAGAVNASGWGEGCERHQRGEYGPQHSMMGQRQGMRGPRADLNLSAEQVKTLVEARLIMRGNERLKVGDVSEVDADTYRVQIVTVDGSLVREFDVDRNEGPRRMGRHQ